MIIGHASLATFLFALNSLLSILLVMLKVPKKWFYIAMVSFLVLLFAPMFYEIIYTQYEFNGMEKEHEKIEQLMQKDMQRDSIQMGSI